MKRKLKILRGYLIVFVAGSVLPLNKVTIVTIITAMCVSLAFDWDEYKYNEVKKKELC